MASIARSPAVSPVTTSMGRLFDAVAALCGIAPRVTYEGQAAIELAAAAGTRDHGAYDFDGLDPRPAVRAAAEELAKGVAVETVAARFHEGVAIGHRARRAPRSPPKARSCSAAGCSRTAASPRA